MASPMTGRERVNRMFQRRDHDRVPRHDTYWTDTIQRWQSEGLEGGVGAVLSQLDGDFEHLDHIAPCPYPDRREIVGEDERTEAYVDPWGATLRAWKDKCGTPEHIGFGCTSRQTWEEVYKPIYQKLQPAHYAQERATAQFGIGRKSRRWCFLSYLESFEATRRMMGDEITLIAMAEDPDWVVDVSRTYTDVLIKYLEFVVAGGIEPDGMWMAGDMAYNHGTMCSPQMYRDLIWPDHKRLVDWCHQRGMYVIFHTDGDVNGVLDLYIEAGIDCLQPLEAKANMDLRRLCPDYSDRLAFFGNIDMTVLGSNDRDRIEAEARTKLDAGKATKGYAYHSDHSVPPTVSWSSYQYLIELLDTYGWYEGEETVSGDHGTRAHLHLPS